MQKIGILSQLAGFFNTLLLISEAGERLAQAVFKWL